MECPSNKILKKKLVQNRKISKSSLEEKIENYRNILIYILQNNSHL